MTWIKWDRREICMANYNHVKVIPIQYHIMKNPQNDVLHLKNCNTGVCASLDSYDMMTSSNGNISALLAIRAGNSPVPVNSPHKGQWRRAWMFYLICVWINGWVNNHKAGDLRRYHAHYDVTVVTWKRFPHYWPFVSVLKQSCCRWFETPWIPHDFTVILTTMAIIVTECKVRNYLFINLHRLNAIPL